MGLSPLSAPRASTRSQRPSRLAALLPSALAAALALAVAAPAGAQSALEQAMAGNPKTARAVPDFSKLQEPVPALKSIVTDPPGPYTD